jgi:hypothetical protein
MAKSQKVKWGNVCEGIDVDVVIERKWRISSCAANGRFASKIPQRHADKVLHNNISRRLVSSVH